MYTKDPYEAKYHFLINKRNRTRLKHLNDPKSFIECSNHMEDIKEYNISKKYEILIVFDDMIADMINNKKLNSIVAELFIIRHFSCFYYTILF